MVPLSPALRRASRAAVAAVGCAVMCAPTGAAAVAPDTAAPAAVQSVTLLYHADLDGRFARPACDGASAPGADYAGLVGLLTQARATARGASEPSDNRQPGPLTLLGGNLATPDLMGRTLLERGASGAATLAALLARGGYDAVALGHHDLSLEPPQLQQLLDALRARGLTVVATNLRCDGARGPVCATVAREVVIKRGSSSIGVLATISPSVLPGIPLAARRGLSLDAPVAAVRAAVRRLRARGAAWVILMTQGPRDLRGLEEIDALQRAFAVPSQAGPATVGDRGSHGVGVGFDASDRPDVILAGGLADDDGDQALRSLRRDQAPPVVGSQPGVSGLSQVILGAGGNRDGVTVEALDAGSPPSTPSTREPAAADAETRALLAPEITAYCSTYEAPLAPAPVRGTLSRDGFVRYALEVMRRRAGSEIALLNGALVKRAPFPITGALTRGKLHRALPYRAIIGVARITGGAVESVLGGAVANSRLVAAGLARTGAGLQVNGRPIDKARYYRVATIAFVASGGDDLLPANALPWRPLDGEPELRDTIEAFLRSDTARRDGDATVDVDTDFGKSPADRPLIVVLTDVGLDASDTRIANSPAYSDAQLVRANQQNLKGEGTVLMQLRHPVHEADTRINLKYGFSRTQPIGMAAVAGETTDLITVSSIYNYRGLAHRLAAARVLAPDPYARVGLESEFTRPDVSPTQSRTFHHLELTTTAGALFTLTPVLKVRAGAGARKELLAPLDDGGMWRPAFEAGGALAPLALATLGPLAVKLEGLIDYYFVDPAGVREHQLRGSGKLSVPLLPLLFITAGLDFFAIQRERLGWGASYDTTIGLRVHLDAAHQWL
jgi:2',3'-cyclic-nucleotide 2'-phosphodiesterase (5'-nucleotidase family)